MLDDIKARHKEASAGDWQWMKNRTILWAALTPKNGILVLSCPNDDFGDLRPTEGDAAFIANAPTDIQWLITEVERLRAELNRANVALEVVLRERATLD